MQTPSLNNRLSFCSTIFHITANTLGIAYKTFIVAAHVLTFEHVLPFRQGESAHVSGTQEGKGVQLVVCEQSEPHAPAEQTTRY